MSATSSRVAPLDIDPGAFAGALGKTAFRFRHGLAAENPLMTLPVLAERADDWPPAWIEHHLAAVPLLLPSGEVERLPQSGGDIIRGLAGNGCWIVLWHLEQVPAYRALLDEYLDVVEPAVVAKEGSMGERGANAFLGSPGGIVPVHFDRHHNLLLQVQGTKKLMIGRFPDDSAAQAEVERHYGVSRNLEVVPPDVTVFELGPGDGVYIPPYAFHWVTGGPEVSVAFSCGFRSPRSERDEVVYALNAKLRRKGLSPRPPGRSEVRDRAKAEMVRSVRRVRRAMAGRRKARAGARSGSATT